MFKGDGMTMSMYIGFRFKGIIKKEYGDDIIKLITEEVDCDDEYDFRNTELNKMPPGIPGGEIVRYMPEEWGYEPMMASDGFDGKFYPENGFWTFQCSISWTRDVVEKILDVFDIITDEVIHFEIFHESADVSDLYIKSEASGLERLKYLFRYYEKEKTPFWGKQEIEEKDNDKYYHNNDISFDDIKYRVGTYIHI